MMIGLRIVDQDEGKNCGFVRAVALRQVVPALIVALLGRVPLVGPPLGLLFVLADYLCLFGDQRRCLHDFIAGTKVVEG
jgi:hypothetical protein